jgi:type I restriction enzyme S subunit
MSWDLKSFDEIGFIGRGKSRHRPRNAEHLYGGEYPFVQTGDIKAAGFRINEYRQTYNEAGLAQSKLWKEGTLCITIAANIADTAILGIDACFPDSIIGFVPYADKSDVRFVKYFFDIFQVRMKSISTGTAQDNLSLEKLLTFKIPTPPLSTQRKIAGILSAYDDLIENNLKRIKLLEEKAFLRYKEIVRSEKLEPVKLKDVAVVNQSSLKSNSDIEKLLYVDIASVSTGSIDNKTEYELKEAPGRAKRILKHHDIIWSCVRPNRKSYSFVWRPEENLIGSTGFAVISAKTIPATFLYQLITTNDFVSYLENHAKGATYPAVTASDFEDATLLICSKNIMDEYHEEVNQLFELKYILQKQNSKLREARDILLPKLMNGQIEV